MQVRPDGRGRTVTYQLFVQLLLASLVIVSTTMMQALFVSAAFRFRPWVAQRLRVMPRWWVTVLVGVAALWLLLAQIITLWIWATLLIAVGAFPDLEEALYYAITSYTSVGFGDVVAPQPWRILGATIAANGMLGFGVATASLIALVLQTRSELRQ